MPQISHQLTATVLDLAGPGAGRSAIDVASGLGRTAAALIDHGFDVVGCELDPIRAESARNSGARVDVADLFEWSPPARADVVVATEIIEHLDQSRRSSSSRGLPPG